MIHSQWIVISAVLFPPVAAERPSPTETFPFDPSKWTLVNPIIKQWLAFSDAWGQGKRGFMGKHNDQKGPTERLVEFVGISGDVTSAETNGNTADYRWAGNILSELYANHSTTQRFLLPDMKSKSNEPPDCHVTWLWRKVSEFSRSVFWRVGKRSAGWGRRTRWLRVKADGLRSLHQSAHKGDVIDRAGQNKAATFGALRAPPLPIAPILSHFMFTDYFPLPHCPIIPQQQQANLSIQLGSRLPSCCVI